MKRTTYASKLRSIAEHYGPMSQLSKTAEELSEATSAVMRYSQRPTKLHFKQMAGQLDRIEEEELLKKWRDEE